MDWKDFDWQLENYKPAPEGIMDTIVNPPASFVVECLLAQKPEPRWVKSGLAWLKESIDKMKEQDHGT
jgi:hypothetical protein